MKTYQLQTHLWLPQPREEIFSFFSDPKNLDRLTPPWLHFEILTPKCVEMRAGTLLDYRLRLHRVPIRWQSEITVWDPPCRFVDRQTRGPYRLWVHEHTFAVENGGTVVGDHVTYAALGGPLIHRLFVAPDLAKIFRYRQQILREIFNPNETKSEIRISRSETIPKT
jgi:ligand-binding SRPBCC domain-containing protein